MGNGISISVADSVDAAVSEPAESIQRMDHSESDVFSNQVQHIQKLFRMRAKDDSNSTTLANTLNKDIETVFNTAEKFVFELLQNADDSGLPDRPVTVSFKLIKNQLIVSHNGKHFDMEDVNAICDNAQPGCVRKRQDIEKTGYKGIGFKSVFVIADTVHIISGGYSFRFDKHYPDWKTLSPGYTEGQYPWQIIPIWTPVDQVKATLDPDKVHFILSLKPHIELNTALQAVLSMPQVILFMRRTESIRFERGKESNTIAIKKLGEVRRILLNDHVHSDWLLYNRLEPIPPHVKLAIAHMGPHECPQKLKEAEHTTITFAARLVQGKLASTQESRLYSYLPTAVTAELPMLINADFLLTADRTTLLNNAWNRFLFSAFANMQIHWLSKLALIPEWRDQILHLFAPMIKRLPDQICLAYSESFARTLEEIPFIPAYIKADRLLLVKEAVVDNTRFFQVFSEIAPPITYYIVRYELEALKKLTGFSKQFEFLNLIQNLVGNTGYATQNKTINFQRKLLGFFIKYLLISDSRHSADSNIAKALQTTPFLLANNDELLAPGRLLLSPNVGIEMPHFVNLVFIHPDLLSVDGAIAWLLSIGVQTLTLEESIRKMVEIFSTDSFRWTKEISLEAVAFIFRYFLERHISEYTLKELKKCLLLITQSGRLLKAQECYLLQQLHPAFNLQAIAPQIDIFISDDYMNFISDDAEWRRLREFFLMLGVTEQLQILSHGLESWGEDESFLKRLSNYRDYLKSNDGVSFFGSKTQDIYPVIHYINFMECLPHPAYAKVFWKLIIAHWDRIYKPTQVTIASNKRSQTYPVTPYLVFYLKTNRCLLGSDQQLHTVNELMAPHIIEEFQELSLGPVCRAEPFIKLTKEQGMFFGFKQSLSAENYITIFNSLGELKSSTKTDSYYGAIYRRILDENFSSTDVAFFQKFDGKLLASDGSLQPIRSLKFCADPCLRISLSAKSTIRCPAKMSEIQLQKIAHFFNLAIIDPDSLRYEVAGQALDMALQSKMIYLLKLVVLLANHDSDLEEKRKKLEGWVALIQKLECYSVKQIFLNASSKQAGESLPLLLIKNKLYVTQLQKKLVQSRFIHLIEKYLRFSSEELAIFLEIFSLDEHELQEYCSDNSVSLDYVAELMQESDDSEAAYDEEQEEASSVPILKTASVPVLSVRQRVTSDSLQTKTHSRQPSVAAVKTSIVNKSSLFSSQAVDVVPEKVNYSAVSCSLRAHAVAKTSQPKKLSLLAEKQEDRDESVYGVEKCLPFEFNRTAVSQKITATEKTDLEDTELQRKIGRWGEHFVFDYLRHHYQEKYPACTLTSLKNGFRLIGSDKKGLALNLEVTWYNQTDESGYPADIGITKNGKQRFIEVKSTNQPGESMAYITGNELKFMKEHGDRYRIFRVYNACQQDPNIVKIKDPARVMQEGGLEPYRIQVKI